MDVTRRVPLVAIVLVSLSALGVNSSRGDTSWIFNKCAQKCVYTNCSGANLVEFQYSQSTCCKLIGWHCEEQCSHQCMWTTIADFQHRRQPIPQFYGKWTFIRVLGLQEPASVLFSMMNGLPYCFMVSKFKQRVSPLTPMRRVWQAYMIVSLNTWFWSAVFHARDTPFTEFMDYTFAFSYVLMCFYVLCMRLVVTSSRPVVSYILTSAFLTVFCMHASILARDRIDYGYNMKANLIIGAMNSCGWVLWALVVYLKSSLSPMENNNNKPLVTSSRAYVWKAAVCSAALMICATLELMEFSPIYWTFDSHSLWHLSTTWIPYLLYSFIIDDCRYLSNCLHSSHSTSLYADQSEPLLQGIRHRTNKIGVH